MKNVQKQIIKYKYKVVSIVLMFKLVISKSEQKKPTVTA